MRGRLQVGHFEGRPVGCVLRVSGGGPVRTEMRRLAAWVADGLTVPDGPKVRFRYEKLIGGRPSVAGNDGTRR